MHVLELYMHTYTLKAGLLEDTHANAHALTHTQTH
jgi:hypothetical protein